MPCVTSLNCVDQSSCSPKWSLDLSAKCKTNSHYLLVLYVQLIHSLMKLIFVQMFSAKAYSSNVNCRKSGLGKRRSPGKEYWLSGTLFIIDVVHRA